MEYMFSLSDFIRSTYGSLAILLLASYWLLPNYRSLLIKPTVWLNYFLIFGSFVFLIYTCISISNLSGNEYKQYGMISRLTGPYWFVYWIPIVSNGIIPQLLWTRKIRRSIWFMIVYLPFAVISIYVPRVGVFLFSEKDFLPVTFSLEIILVPLIAFGILLIAIFSLIKRIRVKAKA